MFYIHIGVQKAFMGHSQKRYPKVWHEPIFLCQKGKYYMKKNISCVQIVNDIV